MNYLFLSAMVDETRKGLMVDGLKGLTLRQIRYAFNIHNDMNNLNDTFDETTMNDLDIGNFDDIQASPPNVESMSPTFAQSNYSIGAFYFARKKA
ncbi:hypothetical protein CR513_35921, partial [Mucuna pruriens]